MFEHKKLLINESVKKYYLIKHFFFFRNEEKVKFES